MEDFCYMFEVAKNKKFYKFLTEHAESFIFQKLEKVTRRSAILDLILTSREELVDEEKVVGTLSSSGHVILEFRILEKRKAVHN